MPSKKYNAFISYSHSDGEDFAKKLKKRIIQAYRRRVITFWQDYDNMQYGQWNRQIEEAIDAAEFLVLIITPKALNSPNCKNEWMYARKQGVCILPVNGLPNRPEFFDEFPGWLKKQHVYNLDKQWERFIYDLNNTPKTIRIPFMAPRLSEVENYVERKEKFAELKNLLLHKSAGSIVSITTVLQGAGGFGKTTLAVALCNDDEIIHDFDDGILWVTLGQQPGTSLTALQKLYYGLTGETRAFVDVEQAQQQLGEKMGKRNCLVVVDDVWHRADIETVLKPLQGCTTLFTTRFDNIIEKGTIASIPVNEMTEQEGLGLLTAPFKGLIGDTSPFKELAEKLGYWPLLLKLAAGQLNHRMSEGEKPVDTLNYVNKKFERKGLAAFDLEDADQRNESVKKCLEASINLLQQKDKSLLLQLGIFPEDADIPYKIAAKLWELDEFDTEELLLKFHRLGLIDLDFPGRSIKIHDVLLRYYAENLSEPKHLHVKLCNELSDFLNFTTTYEWQYHIWHLQYGDSEKALQLLQDFEWIKVKLFETDINHLLKDYEYFPIDEVTSVIYKGLKLSAAVLVEDNIQVAAQIIGRLGYFNNAEIKNLVESAGKWCNGKFKWLKSIIPALNPPGYLQEILKGHADWVEGALLYQGQVISWSMDKTLRIWDIASGKNLHVLEGHSGVINGALIHQDKIVSWSEDHTLIIWDITSGESLAVMEGHANSIYGVLVHQDKIISWSEDCSLRIWDLSSGNTLHILEGHSHYVLGALIHQDKIISWSSDDTLRIWDLALGNCLYILEGHTYSVVGAKVYKDKIISWSWDGSLRIWDMTLGESLHILKGHSSSVNGALIHRDKIISWSGDKTLQIWDIESGKNLYVLEGHSGAINGALIQQDKIVSWSEDCTLIIWDMASGKRLHVLEGHSFSVEGALIFNKQIVSWSLDSTPRIWDEASGKCLYKLEGHSDRVEGILAYQNKLISWSWDKTLLIWDISFGHTLNLPEAHAYWVLGALIHQDKITSWSWDSTLRIWDIVSGRCLHILEGHADSINGVLIYQNKLISWSDDTTLRIWDIDSGVTLHVLEGHFDRVSGAMIYLGKIISWSVDKTLRIWDITEGKSLHILEGHADCIYNALIYQNKLISWSFDKTIRIWDINSGMCLHELKGHFDAINGAMIYQGKIISWSRDKTLRIWDIHSGKILHVLEGHTNSITGALMSEDKIISWSGDETLRIWDIVSGKTLNVLTGQAGWISNILIHRNKIISWTKSSIMIWNSDEGSALKELNDLNSIKIIKIEDNYLYVANDIGSFIIYELDNYSKVACYYADAEILSVHVEKKLQRIILGDKSGKVHFLQPVGFVL